MAEKRDKEAPASWTAERREAFLAELAATANVRRSVESVGMSVSGLYKLRKANAAFRKGWDEALIQGYGLLEVTLLERALHGVERTVRQEDGSFGTERVFSDRLSLALLAIHRATVAELRKRAPQERKAAEMRRDLEAKMTDMRARLREAEGPGAAGHKG